MLSPLPLIHCHTYSSAELNKVSLSLPPSPPSLPLSLSPSLPLSLSLSPSLSLSLSLSLHTHTRTHTVKRGSGPPQAWSKVHQRIQPGLPKSRQGSDDAPPAPSSPLSHYPITSSPSQAQLHTHTSHITFPPRNSPQQPPLPPPCLNPTTPCQRRTNLYQSPPQQGLLPCRNPTVKVYNCHLVICQCR